MWRIENTRLRDCKGIYKLPRIQLILPYKIMKGSSEIHLISLTRLEKSDNSVQSEGKLVSVIAILTLSFI